MPRKRKQLSIGPTFQTVRLQPPPPVSLANVDDLLMEILLRLPAKSLSRFKCVCKKWLSLISSDHLCHLHTLRRPKLQPSIILQFWGKRFYFNPSITINGEKKMIPYSPSVPYYHTIEQACNGLMLLKRAHIDPTTNQFGCFRKMSYYVYNPTTRQTREIMSFDVREYPEAIGLAFDPSKSPYYKIVCIRSIGESDVYTYQIEVDDSESHTWKLSLEPYIDNCPLDFSGAYGTYWNNAMYWRHNNNMGDDSYICFDIGKNQVKTLSFPETPPGFDESKNLFFNTYLQESDGHLYHFEYFNEQMWPEEDDKELVIVSVWELVVGHDDSQWIFKNHHRLTTAEHCAPYYILRSMGGSGSGSGSGSDGDGTCSLLTYWAGKMWAYRFLDKSYEDLLDLTIQPWFQPDYQKRLNVQYYQFGEVLALV